MALERSISSSAGGLSRSGASEGLTVNEKLTNCTKGQTTEGIGTGSVLVDQGLDLVLQGGGEWDLLAVQTNVSTTGENTWKYYESFEMSHQFLPSGAPLTNIFGSPPSRGTQ